MNRKSRLCTQCGKEVVLNQTQASTLRGFCECYGGPSVEPITDQLDRIEEMLTIILTKLSEGK